MPSQELTYIKSVRLAGYRSIKNVSTSFEPGLNVIIGNNGSGKTNLLEFLFRILKRRYSGLNSFQADIEYFDLDYPKGTIWHADGTPSDNFKDLTNSGLTINHPPAAQDPFLIFIPYRTPEELAIFSKELSLRYDLNEERFNWAHAKGLTEWWYFGLLFYFSHNKLAVDKLESDNGSDYLYSYLSAALVYTFDIPINSLREYSPIEDIRFSNTVRVARIDASTLELRNIVLEYRINGDWFSWEALSDGSKRLVFSIFQMILPRIGEEPNSKIPITLLEEPELGIHPHQLHLFLTFLKERAKNQQIILTTHSPQVLDVLGADDLHRITIAEIDYEKGTTLRKLTAAETDKAKAYLNDQGLLSDYWRFSDFQRSKLSK